MTDKHPTIAVRLTPLALIEARGADAGAFLQGQLSNDVRRVTPERAQLSSYNSPKGRMLAVLHLLRDAAGDGYWLELPRSLLEPTLKRLRMYVLRSKVTLAEAGDRVLFGLAGPGSPAAVAHLGLAAPTAALDCARGGGITVIRRLGEAPRYVLIAPAAEGEALWQRLSQHAAEADYAAWRRTDIEAGVPTVFPETQDRFVAQMCNLDQLGGISFDKGCYTGQEVIARVHYRGAVKRHMAPQHLDGAPPAPGTKLESGEVVDAVARPEGGSLALVVGTSPTQGG